MNSLPLWVAPSPLAQLAPSAQRLDQPDAHGGQCLAAPLHLIRLLPLSAGSPFGKAVAVCLTLATALLPRCSIGMKFMRQTFDEALAKTKVTLGGR